MVRIVCRAFKAAGRDFPRPGAGFGSTIDSIRSSLQAADSQAPLELIVRLMRNSCY
jgi:hypothetical protein